MQNLFISKTESHQVSKSSLQAQPNSSQPVAATDRPTGKWTATHRARLPHKAGLPLSSGGCGDAVTR